MAKGNLFLGYARGKVGDVVFYHSNGEQITRARNRSPKNPRSPLQQLQRICMNTASKAFSMLQGICNHSFEGYQTGTPNQSEFLRLNVNMLRDKLAYPIAYPYDDIMRDSDAYNYNQLGDSLPVANEWIVSSGSLFAPGLLTSINDIYRVTTPYKNITASSTYADMCEALGVQRGDQLTFLVATQDTSTGNEYLRAFMSGFTYARIIMEPSNGDMSTVFLSGSGDNMAVSAPNPSNEGVVIFSAPSESSRILPVNSINDISRKADDARDVYWPALGALIVSRRVGDRWLRSNSHFRWTRQSGWLDGDTFGMAYLSYLDSRGSSLYLNQAE